MKIGWNKILREFHFWGSLVIFIPVVIVIATGILLQVKLEGGWLPPTVSGKGEEPRMTFADILESAKQAPKAGIEGWEDVDRLLVLPDKGVTKVRAENNWEVQVDHQTGEILHVGYRWVSIIEDLHDGSWFDSKAKLWIFLPSAIILLVLWISGIYMIILPYWSKWRSARKRRHKAATSGLGS